MIKPPINEGDVVQVVNGKYTPTGTVLGFTPVFKSASKAGEPTGWLITVRCECCGVCESWPEKQVKRVTGNPLLSREPNPGLDIPRGKS